MTEKNIVYATAKKHLTTEDAQSYLQISRSTLYRLIHEGALPAYKVGNRWRFLRTELDASLGRIHAAVAEPSATYEDEEAAFSCGVSVSEKEQNALYTALKHTNAPYHPATSEDVLAAMWGAWQDAEGWRSLVCSVQGAQSVLLVNGAPRKALTRWRCDEQVARTIGKIWTQWDAQGDVSQVERPGLCDCVRGAYNQRYVLRLARTFAHVCREDIFAALEKTQIGMPARMSQGDWRVVGPACEETAVVAYHILAIICKTIDADVTEVVCCETEPTVWYSGATHAYAATPWEEDAVGATVYLRGYPQGMPYAPRTFRTPRWRVSYSYYSDTHRNDIWVFSPAGRIMRLRW